MVGQGLSYPPNLYKLNFLAQALRFDDAYRKA